MTATEFVVSECPLVIRRRVKWGDCDPAGVVYTPVFSEYVISAAELLYGVLFNTTPQRAKAEQSFGTPTRALSFDFQSSLRPDDEFDMTVSVAAVNTKTYALEIVAKTPDGKPVFAATLTPVCVVRPERKSIEIPAAFRAVLLSYQANCEKFKTTCAKDAV